MAKGFPLLGWKAIFYLCLTSRVRSFEKALVKSLTTAEQGFHFCGTFCGKQEILELFVLHFVSELRAFQGNFVLENGSRCANEDIMPIGALTCVNRPFCVRKFSSRETA